MAIINSITMGKSFGSLGNVTLRLVGGDTIASQKVMKKGKGGTVAQVKIRARWGNLVNLYRAFAGALRLCFEGLNARVTDFNAFIKKNIMASTVYLTSGEVASGGAVVFAARVSDGTLPSIAHTMGTGDVIVSSIALGSMAITASTTLKAFSQAVINNNPEFQAGDQISAFLVKQQVNTESGIPYVEVLKQEVTLDVEDEDTILRDLVTAECFSVVDNHVGFGASINGGGCYVHSRKTANGIQVSGQNLVVTNSILPTYQTAAQRQLALESYHAESDVPFIVPNIVDPAAPVTP